MERKNSSLLSIVFIGIILTCMIVLVLSSHKNWRYTLYESYETLASLSSGLSKPSLFKTKDLYRAAYNSAFGYPKYYETPEIDIQIRFEDYLEIRDDRKKAIKNQLLLSHQEVPANIFFDGNSFEAKVRLKGHFDDHWRALRRASFRIKLKGSATILGSNVFSIQKPSSRQAPYDKAFQSVARSAGLLATEQRYVRIKLNGESWGLMLFEEQVSKQMIELQGKKDSLVFKIGSDQQWRYPLVTPELSQDLKVNDNARALTYKFYKEKMWLKNELFRKQASHIVEALIEENSAAFDFESFASLISYAIFWGNFHVLHPQNCLFYFNPYTLKIEPISKDQGNPSHVNVSAEGFLVNESLQKLKLTPEGAINQLLLGDKGFRSELRKSLLNPTFSYEKASLELEEFRQLFPLDPTISLEGVKNNISTVSAQAAGLDLINLVHGLNYRRDQNSDPEIAEHVRAFHYTDGSIKLINLTETPILLESLIISGQAPLPLNFEISPSSKKNPKVIQTELVGIYDNKLSIKTSLDGREITNEIPFSLIAKRQRINPFADLGQDLPDFVRQEGLRYYVGPGDWTIKSPILIAGDLEIAAGAKLSFSDGAALLVQGSVTALGTKKAPIIFNAKDTGWLGLYIIGDGKRSTLRHFEVTGTTGLDLGLLKLTGGVTFFDSNLEMSDAIFADAKGEDALNVVNSKFYISRVLFKNVSSDAFDSDHSFGSLEEINLSNVGGDGLDFSGGETSISNVNGMDVNDKLVSVGEASSLVAANLSGQRVGVGIAVKDGSKAYVNGISINDAKVATAMTYKKKPFYDQPSLELINLQNFEASLLVRSQNSLMTINGKAIPPKNIDVEELYRTVMKK